MQLRNLYYYFKDAFSEDDCNKIIWHGLETLKSDEEKGKNTSGVILDDNLEGKEQGQYEFSDITFEEYKKQNPNIDTNHLKHRDSNVCFLNYKWIYEKLNPLLQEANVKSGWKFEYDTAESLQFTVYRPGQYYNWHQDGGSDSTFMYNEQNTTDNNLHGFVRKISMTLNLSPPSDYEGGKLKLDVGPHTKEERFKEITEINSQGSLVFFPSFTWHQVTPVTKGTRYSLVMWVVGKPFK